MRIAILADYIPPYNIGGGGKIPWLLAKGFLQQNADVHIITSTPDPSYEETREGMYIHYVQSYYPSRWRAWFSVYNPLTVPVVDHLLRTIKPDVVHGHNVHTHLSFASFTTARQLGIPVVFLAHDTMSVTYGKLDHFVNPAHCDDTNYRLPPGYNLRVARLRYNPFRYRAIRRILERDVSIRTAVSSALRQALEANGMPRFRVVHNGFDPHAFDAPSMTQTLRRRLGLSGCRVVFFGGRLTPAKGGLQLLRALDRIVPHVPNLRLLLLSASPFDPAALEGLSHLCEDHICQGGWLDAEELVAAYHLADVVAVPPIYLDPFPNTALEAMSASRPVVASCFGGVSEVVQNGHTGYVVNPFDTEQFADRLLRLLENPTQRQQMGHAGRQRITEHFSFAGQIANFFALFEEAISSKRW